MILGSKFFAPMRKSVNQELTKSHQLLVKSGMISQLGAGLFSWLPLGMRVLNKVRDIVGWHHEQMGFNECCAPIAQPAELWMESGRYKSYGEETMRVIDRHNKELVLGPTAEEAFVDMVRQNTWSYKDLPVNIYNIQWKFRDEIRPRFGLMRCREFLMCDAYSFHADSEESEQFYNHALVEYLDMFRALGFVPIPIRQNDTGEIGGKTSHEFFAVAETGENNITFDEQWLNNINPLDEGPKITRRAIELGHVFLLGTKYSEMMKLSFDLAGRKGHPFMGCYGTGVSRLVGAYAEIFGWENGIRWPSSVAPFAVHIIGSPGDRSQEVCNKLHNIWEDETYYDDRKTSFGEKMVVADLVGAPIRVIAGDKEVATGSVLINQKLFSINEATNYILDVARRNR